MDSKLKDAVIEEFDVVIIGAGISGLTAAALLSKANLKVCVLERHYLIGGYLQGFERNDFIFDTAIHWLNQCGENGTVSKVFDYLGKDYPKPLAMHKIHRHLSDKIDYTLTNNPEDLKKELIRDFPNEENGINKFFDTAKKVAAISLKFPQLFRSTETMGRIEKIKFTFRKIKIGFPLVKYVFYSGEKGMKKGLGKFFTDEKLLSFWSTEKDLLSCLFPIAWAYNNDYQNPPIGGSQVFPKWLSEQINYSNGTELRLNAKVSEILVTNNKFEGVKYISRAKEYTVFGKHLIAACDTDVLYTKLLPQSSVPKEIIEKLNNSELYSSSVTISIALNCPSEDLGFKPELTLVCNDSNSREEHSAGDPYKAAISVLSPSIRDKSMSPDNKGILTLYVPAWMNYENNWRTEINSKGEMLRTDAYKALKEQYAQVIIDRVSSKLCPTLRNHILFYEVATPVTYHRYSQNKNGTMMGTRPGKINMQSKVAHYKTPINNITVGGQWAELGGGVPIAVKAAYNASLIVLKDLNIREFNNLVEVMEKNKSL